VLVVTLPFFFVVLVSFGAALPTHLITGFDSVVELEHALLHGNVLPVDSVFTALFVCLVSLVVAEV